jgi:hypothetical protein
MPRRFSTDVDLLNFSLLNAMMNPVSSDPGGLGVGDAGRLWFRTDTTPPSLRFWTGTTAVDVKDLASGTGSLLSSKISDLAATVQAYALSQFAAPTADLSLASHKLTNVTDGTSAQDAATKGQLDAALAGLSSGQVIKGLVRCAATTNITLSSPGATIDGITMTNGDVVLLTAQSTGSQNGPYVWTASGSPLTRATNWNTSGLAVLGSYWIVEQGSKADNYALLTNDSAITLGTTTPAFTFIGNATYTGGNGISVTTGTITAIQTTGVVVNGSGIGADFAVVGRKFAQGIPATSGGAFTVTANVIVINHGLSNAAPVFVVRAGSVPVAGYTTGQLVEMDNSATDTNNITLTLPGVSAPIAGNWLVTVIG